MGIFKRLFAKPEDGSKIIDGAIKGLDALFFTDEEKSQANAKLSEWYLKYLAATEGQNLARRLIAIIVVCIWSALIVLSVIARSIEVWLATENVLSDFILALLVDVAMVPFGIVIGFYFLTHTVRAYKKE